jgi:hypothetical protein
MRNNIATMRRALLTLTALAALASAAVASVFDRPKVVVVPVLNLSGEKWEELKTKQANKATEYLRAVWEAGLRSCGGDRCEGGDG